MNVTSFINEYYGRSVLRHSLKLVTAFLLLSFAVSIQNVAGDSKGNKAILADTVHFSNLTNDICYGIRALNSAVLKAEKTPKAKLLAEVKVLKGEVDKAISHYKKADPSMLKVVAELEESLSQYYTHAFYFINKVQSKSVSAESSSKRLFAVTKQLETRFLAMTSSLDNLKKSS